MYRSGHRLCNDCTFVSWKWFSGGYLSKGITNKMSLQSLNFVREFEMPIFYGDIQIGKRRADFFVEDEVMLELKAIVQYKEFGLRQ